MELIKLLPEYYHDNNTMKLLQKILSDETDDLEDKLSNTIRECFVMTASASLSRHEKIYGIEVDVNKSDEFRRERISAKISGVGTTTKAMIMDVARRYSNGEVEVVENSKKNQFTIKFTGTLGIPGNMADLQMTIQEIKPAHLAVDYEYVYNTWRDVGQLTWSAALAHTWEGIRTVNI